MIKQLLFLPLLCLVLLSMVDFTPTAENRQEDLASPNFVIIMADDLGYGDISPFDGWIHTPHLDQLAKEGMRFTDFYASGPVCSPTRAGLLTGRYQQRAGIPGVVYAAPERNRHHGLQLSEQTFAEELRKAGYATGMFGKWHLGYEAQYNPVHHGFDEFRGYVSGNVDYFSHVDQAGFYDWWAQDQLINEPGYVTHLITEHAVSFIEQNSARPFVLYLPHEAPHYPFQGPDDEGFRIVHQQVPEKRDSLQVKRAYREMVQELDTGIGEVMQTLQRLNLDENTVVLFFSDNGATHLGSNGALRGQKGSLWEGGIRVPAIARWKGKIEAGSTSRQQAITLDIFPTIKSLAGISTKDALHLDGIDLTSTLMGQAQPKDRTLFWQYGNAFAMREGPWKIHKDKDQNIVLFNLTQSPGEQIDQSKTYPDRVKSMNDQLTAWENDVSMDATPQPEKHGK